MSFKVKEDLRYYKLITKKSDAQIAQDIGISRISFLRLMSGDDVSFSDLETIYSMFYNENFQINRIKEELYKSYEDQNNLVLFHGAKGEIKGNPSVTFSGINKDFGKGFYLGCSIEQASSFVSTYNESSVYVYKLKKTNELKIKEYSVSEDWMLLIAYLRGKLDRFKTSKRIHSLLEELKDIDLVIAPTLDNTMYSIMNEFINGDITNLQCMYSLSANRLGKQYVILNDKTINDKLELIERCYVSKPERDSFVKKREADSVVGKVKVTLAKRQYAGNGKYIEELFDD